VGEGPFWFCTQQAHTCVPGCPQKAPPTYHQRKVSRRTRTLKGGGRRSTDSSGSAWEGGERRKERNPPERGGLTSPTPLPTNVQKHGFVQHCDFCTKPAWGKKSRICLVMDNQSKRVPLGKTRSKKDCRFDFPLCVSIVETRSPSDVFWSLPGP
jgi:hypothetical protein